ncbi:MAG: cation-translocating P-type ATPase, partial [Chthoniobacterales bacterium]
IAALIHEAGAEEATPLQKKLESLGRVLVWASLGIVAVLFVLGLLRHTPAFEMFLTSVSLAVAAVPEGLPAVVTIALALGVLRMSRRHALVRRLPSVETLGSTSVICTDKTGTLTRGEMTVRALYVAGKTFEVTGEGYEPDGEVRFEGKAVDARQVAPLLELADVLIGCNNAHLVVEDGHWQVIGDPTEGATLSVAQKIGANKEELEHDFPRHHEIPFDSDRKRRTVIRRLPNEQLRAFVNGAPELLLDRCTHFLSDDGVRPLTPADRAAIVATNLALAQCSLRVLGSAYRDLDLTVPTNLSADEVERDLTFVGLTGMYDPPRSEVKEAVEEGRGIYGNIRKTLQYLLAGNTGELLLMTVCVAIGFPAPLLPIHLLWINLVTDGLPALCLATDPIEADVMKRAPRPGTERMTDGRFLNTMLLTGILTAAVSFAVYLHALRSGTIELARTYAFAALVFAELLRSFGARSAVRPIWRIRVRNFNLFFVVAASIAIQLWSHHSIFLAGFLKTARIPLSTGVALLFISSLPLVILELRKVMQRAHKPTPQS